MSNMVRLRAFRAVEDTETCERFIAGHTRVLASVGVTKVTSNKAEWMGQESVFVLVVEDMETNEVLGGARVHAYDNVHPLPIEEAVGFMDEKVEPFIKTYAAAGCGEVCGLWNSRKIAGMGFGSVFLLRAALSITDQIGLKSLLVLCAPYTVSSAERFGCRVVKSVGNEGTFYYPKLDLLATFMLLSDTLDLQYAKKMERDKISELRKNPKVLTTERTKISRIEIQYDLRLNMKSKMEFNFSELG